MVIVVRDDGPMLCTSRTVGTALAAVIGRHARMLGSGRHAAMRSVILRRMRGGIVMFVRRVSVSFDCGLHAGGGGRLRRRRASHRNARSRTGRQVSGRN